jgi:hypothetical protein
MVSFARSNSPYYCELYRDLPERVEDPTLLPVTSKQALMAHFDDWVTDREVTIKQARAFVDDSALIGEQFLGSYTLLTTSGTTGTRGIFLLDDRSMAVTGALAFRMLSAWLKAGDVIRIVAGGGRMAMVNAMGGHFASAVAASRLSRRLGNRVQVFPVDMPLAQMTGRAQPVPASHRRLPREHGCALGQRAGGRQAAHPPGAGGGLGGGAPSGRVRPDRQGVQRQGPRQLRRHRVPLHQLQVRARVAARQ